MNNGWIGVDLDGTLAHYDKWISGSHIGEPIPLMLERVKRWIAEGRDVRIFTARVSTDGSLSRDAEVFAARDAIVAWCEKHLGVEIPITNVKDYAMIELWDDRAVQVITNSGIAMNDRLLRDEINRYLTSICQHGFRRGVAAENTRLRAKGWKRVVFESGWFFVGTLIGSLAGAAFSLWLVIEATTP